MNNFKITNENLLNEYPSLMDYLFIDRTTKHNIKWFTNVYENLGKGFCYHDSINTDILKKVGIAIIKSRFNKNYLEKKVRSKDKGEVFTPSWICKKQIDIVDNGFFNENCKLNFEKVESIPLNYIETYINDTRIEIACGEAPYLTTRHDVVTGEFIKIENRQGILDRKLKLISLYFDDCDLWLKKVICAYENTYGYDFQGDNVAISRINLISDFIEYFYDKFKKNPSETNVKKIAEIVSWNIWQMDGLKCVVPNSCSKKEIKYFNLFGEEIIERDECYGCKNNNIKKHNGVYCLIMDWKENRKIRFIDLIKK